MQNLSSSLQIEKDFNSNMKILQDFQKFSKSLKVNLRQNYNTVFQFLKQALSKIQKPESFLFQEIPQKTNLTTKELSVFFHHENWNNSFFTYPYFLIHEYNSSQNKIHFDNSKNLAYLSEKKMFIEWKIYRSIHPLERGKSAFQETWEIVSQNLYSKILLKVFKNFFLSKIRQLSNSRTQTILAKINQVEKFPKIINLSPIENSENFSAIYSIRNIFIFSDSLEWELIKNYFPENFTPKFSDNKISISLVYYSVESINCRFQNSKEITEYFQEKIPSKCDIFAEAYPYSDEKIVNRDPKKIFLGSVFINKNLLQKEIKWNLAPTEIKSLRISLKLESPFAKFQINDQVKIYKQSLKTIRDFQEFGIFQHTESPLELFHPEEQVSGYFIRSGIKLLF